MNIVFYEETGDYCWINLDAVAETSVDSDGRTRLHFEIPEEIAKDLGEDAADLVFESISAGELFALPRVGLPLPTPDDGQCWQFWCFTVSPSPASDVHLYW
ncbi:hypothetical protein [Brasilonema sp. UFV-L1]|uniref:hypothetical protein n=1 Tax=Brasilonema sp. UFV-L1 TaxID=2234130 RepID=UPI00145F09B0|nr:hypothetical protein [Brasilonema sp. UFV-L1]NMG10355.1 hypothetical protein [Brasilonema sp. UFV-L1]